MSDTPRPKEPDCIEVAREGQAVLMRVIGLGSMNTSLMARDFVVESLRCGFRQFALDLANCQGMDSTFMGTLLVISKAVEEGGGGFCLINVSEDNRALLDMVGAWCFLVYREDFPLQSVETERLSAEVDPQQRLALIRKAHENLLAIDARNRARFGRFLSCLSDEMDSSGIPPDESGS